MSEFYYGRILEVTESKAGTELIADHLVGATELLVYTSGPFDESGGQLMILNNIYTYLPLVEDVDSLVIDPPLLTDAEADLQVFLYPLVTEKRAMVELPEVSEDAVMARVPIALYDALEEIIREDTGQESVQLTQEDGGDWVITDILGSSVQRDGSYTDPTTLPEPMPDQPPATSPTLVASGNAESIILRATNIAQTSTIEYHVSTVDGFTPGPSTLIRDTRSLVTVVDRLPDGTSLLLDTLYYFVAVAKNSLGSAPASAQVSSALDSTKVASIALREVVAGFILADTITVGQITIDPLTGITIPLSNNQVIKFPADGSPASIAAQLITSDLTVNGGLVINGANNNVNGDMLLSSGIADPLSAPVVQPDRMDRGTNLFQGHATFSSGTKGGLAKTSGGTEWATIYYKTSGGVVRAIIFADSTTGAYTRQFSLVNNDLYPISLTRAGNQLWVLGQRWDSATSRWLLRAQRYNEDTLALTADWDVVSSAGGRIEAVGLEGAIGFDLVNNTVWVAHRAGSGGSIYLREFNTAGAHQTTRNTGHVATLTRGMWVGAADTSVNSIWVGVNYNGEDRVKVWARDTGAAIPSRDFGVGHSAHGLWYDGTRFLQNQQWNNINGASLYQWSTNLNPNAELAYSWYDDNPSGVGGVGGRHETKVGPRTVLFTIPERSYLRVRTPSPPYNGTNDGANGSKLYTTTTPGDVLRLLETRVSPDAWNTIIPEARVDSLGAEPPLTNNFSTSGSAGRILASDGGAWLDGSSNGSVGNGGFRNSVWKGLAYSERGKVATQTLTNATYTPVVSPTDTADFPTEGITYNAGLYTITQTGLYMINTHLVFAENAVGRRLARLWLNSSNYETIEVPLVAGQATQARPAWVLALAAGEIFEVHAYQNSGGNLDLTATSRVTVAQLTRIS